MLKSEEIYKYLDLATRAKSKTEAKYYCDLALRLDSENEDAIIIASYLKESFMAREAYLLAHLPKPRVTFELGLAYFKAGMYKRARLCFEGIVDQGLNTDFYLLSIYSLMEDEAIEPLFRKVLAAGDEQTIVMASLPYVLYLYKIGEYASAKELMAKVFKIEPTLIAALKGNNGNKLAHDVLRNNATVINSCPGFIDWILD